MDLPKQVLQLEEISENGFEEVSDNGLSLYGLDIFTSQISIHSPNLDLQKKCSHWRIYQTMAFEEVSDNGLFLHGLDIFRSQISIHTLKLDVQKGTPLGEYTRQWPLRKYQKMAFCCMV